MGRGRGGPGRPGVLRRVSRCREHGLSHAPTPRASAEGPAGRSSQMPETAGVSSETQNGSLVPACSLPRRGGRERDCVPPGAGGGPVWVQAGAPGPVRSRGQGGTGAGELSDGEVRWYSRQRRAGPGDRCSFQVGLWPGVDQRTSALAGAVPSRTRRSSLLALSLACWAAPGLLPRTGRRAAPSGSGDFRQGSWGQEGDVTIILPSSCILRRYLCRRGGSF